jgi:hypothetical protein
VKHATYMKKMKNMYKVLNGNMKKREKPGNLDLYGSGLKKRFSKKQCVNV